jgi:hypothetical protein
MHRSLLSTVLTLALVRLDVIFVGDDSTISSLLASGVTSGLLALVTVALTINQLILSRVFGSPNELADRYDAATERIVTVVSTPSPSFDLGEVGNRFADRIAAALDRGVEVRALVDPELFERLPGDVIERYEGLIGNEPGYEVRLAADVAGSFTLIDRAEVCIEVPNPLTSDEPFALIDLTDPEFAADVYEEFEPRWERAERFP